MIRPRHIIPLVFALLFAACSERMTDSVFSLKDDSVSFGGEGGTGEISFVANRDWQASSDAQWCRVFPSSGSAAYLKDHSIQVLCDLNRGDERSCTVKIESEGRTMTATVSQSHASLFTDSLDYSISFHSQLLPVPFRAEDNVGVEADDRCSDWIHPATTKAPLSRDTVWLAVTENRAGVREGMVYINCKGKTDTIRIQQDAQVVPIADKGLQKRLFQHSCDFDQDGLITVAEAEHLTWLDCFRGDLFNYTNELFNLTSAEGLEYFPNITDLSIRTSVLHEFDFSLFKKLRTIRFRGPLESVDLSKNPLLESASLEYTQCGTICLKNLKKLEEITLVGNTGDLDYDGCDSLIIINIARTDQSVLCLPASTSVIVLYTSNSPSLVTLDLTSLTGLDYLTSYKNTSLKTIYVNHRPKYINIDVPAEVIVVD